jgi:hypothetical protein
METVVRRPRLRGILIVNLLGGLLSLFVGITSLLNTNTLVSLGIPSWSSYAFLVLGGFQLLIAVATRTYKRLWLVLGVIVHMLAIVHYILNIISGYMIGGMIWGVLFSLAMLYYAYKYLITEPEKSFFT